MRIVERLQTLLRRRPPTERDAVRAEAEMTREERLREDKAAAMRNDSSTPFPQGGDRPFP